MCAGDPGAPHPLQESAHALGFLVRRFHGSFGCLSWPFLKSYGYTRVLKSGRHDHIDVSLIEERLLRDK